MMTWLKKMREEKKAYRAYRKRMAALPADFRQALQALEKYLNYWAKDGQIYIILYSVLDMFEAAAADGLGVRDVVGTDITAFADSLIEENPEATWINNQREKLRRDAFKK